MQHSFFHRLSRFLWGAVIAAVLVLAVYVTVGRLLVHEVAGYREYILAELNARLPFTVEAEKVDGEWRSFTPELVLTGLRLTLPGSPETRLELGEGRLALDVPDILITRSLQISRLRLDRLSLQAEVTADGEIRLAGFQGYSERRWLREFLLNMEQLRLTNVDLQLHLPDGGARDVALAVDLDREGGRRRLSASLQSGRDTRVLAIAEGIGNPFRTEAFSGELYLDIATADLGLMQSLLPGGPPVQLSEGALAVKLWLALDEGEPRIEGLVDARDLVVGARDGGWQIPLERLSFAASLVERRNRWTLFASDLLLRKRANDLVIPRVQVDSWGDSVRLRSQDISIAQLNRALVELEVTPPPLAEVFRTLQPAGQLSALQLSISDLGRPAAEWLVTANFHDLALDSWRGAPGASNGSGYVELGNGGGHVVIDSRDMSLEFPTVYRQPLRWDEVYGTVDIDLFPDAVVLSSGPLTARGEEGEVRALFDLNIPLQPSAVGLEMDLLAGLRRTAASYRGKYLPYILNPSLLDWLENSITAGRVEQSGFIWRGSLSAGLEEARTVQLFFEVSDTRLEYDAHWPPISGLDGLVLIDDTNVSIWADRAKLYNTAVDFLSAEAWLAGSGQVMLQLDTSLHGDAADGMRVIRESPLDGFTGGTFGGWRLQGELDTDLSLWLNLGDPGGSPRVDLQTRPRDVNLFIEPADLSVTGITGQLEYSSERGFSSTALTGRLWGEATQVEVRQRNTGARYDPATSVLEVVASPTVRVDDLQGWLVGLPLGFASGRAVARLSILVPPRQAPTVRVRSDLRGVTLALPRPFAAGPRERKSFDLQVALGAERTRVSVALEQALQLNLDLADGALRGAAVGFARAPPTLRDGQLRVGGHLPLVEAAEWEDFLQRNFGLVLGSEPAAATGNTPGSTGAAAGAEQARGWPALYIDRLQVDSLSLRGMDLQDLVVSLAPEGSGRELSFELDWLRGRLSLAGAGGVSRLDLDYLDLDRLQWPTLGEGGGEALELPDLDVVARQLDRGGRPLGELAFALRSDGNALQASGITGDLAGLQLWDTDLNSLSWTSGAAGATSLQAQLHFRDLGDTLQRFDYQRILETHDGLLQLALEWPGGPTAFSLGGASGSVRIALGEGRFLEAPAAASGALRVVSILNLAEIVSRLSLSHMFESGIPFRAVDGTMALHGGTIEVDDLKVRGASSGFQFSGRSEVARRSLDGELVVTLPVANNLPWVAALAGGLPVAAGVFVVSKVFEKQVRQLSSAVYKVGGDWDDPRVDFNRIFDVQQPATGDSAAGDATDAPPAGEQDGAAPPAAGPGVPAGGDKTD